MPKLIIHTDEELIEQVYRNSVQMEFELKGYPNIAVCKEVLEIGKSPSPYTTFQFKPSHITDVHAKQMMACTEIHAVVTGTGVLFYGLADSIVRYLWVPTNHADEPIQKAPYRWQHEDFQIGSTRQFIFSDDKE